MATCEPWCSEPCAELNGHVAAECGGCGHLVSRLGCGPGRPGFSGDVKPSYSPPVQLKQPRPPKLQRSMLSSEHRPSHDQLQLLRVIVHWPIPTSVAAGKQEDQMLRQHAMKDLISRTDTKEVRGLQQLAWIGTCNKTHKVLYTSVLGAPSASSRIEALEEHAAIERAALRAVRNSSSDGDDGTSFLAVDDVAQLPAVHVYRLMSGMRLPPRPNPENSTGHLIWGIEPGAHLGFDRVVGFGGAVSFSRSATITASLIEPMRLYHLGQRLRADPRRKTIGVWVDNCGSPWRDRIIDTLLHSGLAVESYGKCRYNMGDLGREVRTDDVEGTRRCRKHRLMLAVENEACPDYVTHGLQEMLKNCGAIPLIATIDGLPKYEELIGSFPLVNASRPGWLTTARRIMLDDTYYSEFVASVQKRAAPSTAALAAEAKPRHLHCQWHDARAAELPARTFRWEQCVYCVGQSIAQERERAYGMWAPIGTQQSSAPCIGAEDDART